MKTQSLKPNSFIGKLKPPAAKDLANALGSAKPLWDSLLSELHDQFDPLHDEWNSYSPKAGWSLKVIQGSRTILYLSPCENSFRASFALGDKAVKAALAADLPKGILRIIGEAKRYAEGAAVRIDVKSASEIESVVRLAAIKIAN